jgi:exodeoxyribonuclease VII large subunit
MNIKAERVVYSVAQLNSEARQLLEAGLPPLWVEGELSNFSLPASGHWYFTLKDRDAQIRCAMFRARNQGVGFKPRDGQQILVRGRVSLYEPRGDYQLIVEAMEDSGEGALRREFDRLKAKLAAAGLFDADKKRALPAIPRRIAIVTSPSGAAVRDVLHVLARRFPSIPILIFPTPVQGAAATSSIVAAIDAASAHGDCDVMILTRGGGSIEDLWCFTIADFAADVRAPTPSAAAELVVPDRRTLLATLNTSTRRLHHAASRQLERVLMQYQQLVARLDRAHPGSRLAQQVQRLDELDMRLRRSWATRHTLAAQRLQLAQRSLHAISPLATLQRGYAIVTNENGAAILDAASIKPGELIEARVAKGRIRATVNSSEL